MSKDAGMVAYDRVMVSTRQTNCAGHNRPGVAHNDLNCRIRRRPIKCPRCWFKPLSEVAHRADEVARVGNVSANLPRSPARSQICCDREA